MPGFLAGAAAQFDYGGSRDKFRDLAGVRTKQTLIGAREPVFGKARDGFEKRASQLVVKILRVQSLFGSCLNRRALSRRIPASVRRSVR